MVVLGGKWLCSGRIEPFRNESKNYTGYPLILADYLQ